MQRTVEVRNDIYINTNFLISLYKYIYIYIYTFIYVNIYIHIYFVVVGGMQRTVEGRHAPYIYI